MTPPPAHPKLYHITHVDNLADIVADGMLVSDAAMIARGGPVQAIGMSAIKRRRAEEEANDNRWAFSLSNAGAYYTELRSRPVELDQLDWNAIAARDFRAADMKEGKQAEFLVHGQIRLAEKVLREKVWLSEGSAT